MRVRVIVNPVAGRRGWRRTPPRERVEIARAYFAGRHHHAEVVVTARPGHGRELARRFVAEGTDRVIAWGGDGTINEVAGPLAGSDVALGIVRGGSGNGFARGLGIPANPHEALDLAMSASPVRLDVGWIGDRHFVNVAGVGFDAAVAFAFSRRRRRGLAGYLVAGFGSVASYRSVTYTLDLDGVRTTAPTFMVAFGNGRQYGNGFMLAPAADPADGYLDAMIVADGSVLRQLWRARRLLLAPGAPAHGIRRRRIQRAEIGGPADLLVHADGEPFTAVSPLAVRVEPAALPVAMPPPKAAGG